MRVQLPGRAKRNDSNARPPQTPFSTRSRGTGSKPTPPATKRTGTCPNCEGVGKLTVEPRNQPGYPPYWVNCWDADCRSLGGEWLRKVAEIVGAPGGWHILEEAPRWLADYLEGERTVRLDGPPSSAYVAGCASRLWTEQDAIGHLLDERGLSESTVRRAELGWDVDNKDAEGGAFVFPIRDASGELVNRVLKPWPGQYKPKYRVMAGRKKENGGVELYPRPLPAGSRLLVGGLIDALLLRQHGIPAITGTHGVYTFLPEWLRLVRGRRIAVAFDVGEEELQRQRVTALRAAGAEAWGVEIRQLGLSDREDLSDYITAGGTADELLRFIKREHRRTS